MPFSEENVLDFVKWLEKSYFVERALGRIEKLLAPEFMMVGTGRREVCYDMPQMRFLLQQEQSGFHDTFLVLSAHYKMCIRDSTYSSDTMSLIWTYKLYA